MNKIIFGCDHAAYELKAVLKNHAEKMGFSVEDVGTHSEESCDYPAIAQKLCRKVLAENTKGILLCGTGIGMSISANRFAGIRAALCNNELMAELARQHNNANVLCLGARISGVLLAQKIVSRFLQTDFAGERHLHRIELIENITKD